MHGQVRCKELAHLKKGAQDTDLPNAQQLGSTATSQLGTPGWAFDPLPFEELPESGMSEMSRYCREAGLEELFLTGLKISKDS